MRNLNGSATSWLFQRHSGEDQFDILSSGAIMRPMSKTKERSKRVLETRTKTGAAAVYALRDRHCKWPKGEPGKAGFHFCGKQSLDDSPYCEAHQVISLRA